MKNPLHTTLLRGALLAATLTGAAAAQGTATFCDPGQPNSTGSAAVLAGTFTGSALHLEATSGPNNQFGYVVVSGSTSAGIPISQGLLCLGSPIGRYNAAAGATKNSLGRFEGGVFVNLSGTSTSGTGFDVPADLPGPINGTITPGQTWNFQLWYRDVGANSNFTNGLAATYSSGAVSFSDVYAAFEQVLANGSLNLAKVSDALDNIEWAAAAYNGSKQVFCSFWAGPYAGFSTEPGLAHGWPKYHDNSQPCGSASSQGLNCTAAQHFAGSQVGEVTCLRAV